MQSEQTDLNELGYRKRRTSYTCPKHGETFYHKKFAGRHICCQPERKWYLFGMKYKCNSTVGEQVSVK